MDFLTQDTLFDGEIVCNQYKNGYRFSVDSVLAAHYLQPNKNAKILDLGCGCGVIGLICLYRWAKTLNISVTGFELQKELADLALQNVIDNDFEKIADIVSGDVKHCLDYFPAESFDQIICNPPFFKIGSGRTSQNEQAYKARHQLSGTLEDFLYGASRLLKNKRSCVFIYPASDFAEFSTIARKFRLEPKRIQPIYNYPEGENEARLLLIQCQKNGGIGIKFERPFYIYEKKNGEFHKLMQTLYLPNHDKDQGAFDAC